MDQSVPRPGRIPLVEVVITDNLDRATLARLGTLLDEALALQPELLLLDLDGCPSIDAAGIGVLLDVHRRAIQAGGRLTLRSPSARLRRNLRLARVDRVLHITPGSGADHTPTDTEAAGVEAAAGTAPR